MTFEERKEAFTRIYAMIGTPEENRKITSDMELQDRIKYSTNYNKTVDNLLKIAEKNGVKALCSVVILAGRHCTGLTAKGKKYIWEGNNGYSARSRYCGSLYIEGEGTVFTSGRIEKVVEYLMNN